jgi:phage shock protein A
MAKSLYAIMDGLMRFLPNLNRTRRPIMQTLNRAKLIVRAHLNDLLTKVEDTRKTRSLMVEEMRENIRSVKSYTANAIADLKLIEGEIAEQEAESKRWEERAVFALKRGEEELARRALARKCEHMNRANRLHEQLNAQREAIESLKSSLRTLEAKLSEARYSSARLAAAESLQSTRPAEPAPVADATLDAGAFDAYDRMVERIRDLEAHAEALAELTRGDDLEQKFRELENKETVDADLAALKSKIAAGN